MSKYTYLLTTRYVPYHTYSGGREEVGNSARFVEIVSYVHVAIFDCLFPCSQPGIGANKIMMMRHDRKKLQSAGGWFTLNVILRALLLIALALFLTSIFLTMNMAATNTPANGSPSLKKKEEYVDHHATTQGVSPPSQKRERQIDRDTQKLTAKKGADEELILQWLRKRNNKNDSASLSQILASPYYFAPGSLPISQLSTLQHCYTDPKIYRSHLKEGNTRRIPYSKKHKLAYIMLPKSGSSTGRFMMKHEFDAAEMHIKIEPPINVVSFVREPLSRFYSQYEETYVRTAPWVQGDNPYYKNDKRLSHPFPFLYDNLQSYKDYQDVFCPKHTRLNPNSDRECVDKESRENGTLASRLERFVYEYDGKSPYDIHLVLQVPLLSDSRTGRALHISELYNTTDSEGGWKAIAKHHLGEAAMLQNAKKNKLVGTKESGGVIQGRSYPRRLDKSLVGEEAEKRICELALLDYCCLNFPLPFKEGGSNGNEKLICKMDHEDGRVRIQPGLFPDKAK